MADSVNNSSSSIGKGNQTSHSSDAGEPPKLSDLLQDGWKTFEEVDTCAQDEAAGGASAVVGVQLKVRRGIAALEKASGMVARLRLFSGNEELEEVATADVKYLLLPALQGALAMKLSATPTDHDKRLEAIQSARAHFYEFLRRCKDYDVARFRMPRRSNTGEEEEDSSHDGEGLSATKTPTASSGEAAAVQRQAKIDRYRQRKETESRIAEMRGVVESGRADDAAVRDFYLLHVRRWVALSLEGIESIDLEMALLLEKRRSAEDAGRPKCDEPLPNRPVPFVLARGAAQARVFGGGYPSQPSMTVDDWYEQHAEHGVLPDQGLPPSRAVAASGDDSDVEARDEEEAGEKQIDDDEDKEALQKARDWDEWKDCHRRGYGNRKNRG